MSPFGRSLKTPALRVIFGASLLAMLSSCGTGGGEGQACRPGLPADRVARDIAATGVRINVPSGWEVGEAPGPQSYEMSAHSEGLSVRAMVVDEGLASFLPLPGPEVIGTETVVLTNAGAISVDRVRDKDAVGLRYVRPWRNGAVEVLAEGPSAVCGGTLVELLGLVEFAPAP